jgi:glycine dehydrogenase
VKALLGIFGSVPVPEPSESLSPDFAAPLARTSPFLAAAVFQRHHTEHEMLRYIKRLEAKDLTLCQSMISARLLHDEAERGERDLPRLLAGVLAAAPLRAGGAGPRLQAAFRDLEAWLAEITGFAAVSLQPNAGSQGEYAGLLVDPRVPRVARRGPPQRVPHPNQRPRHEPRQRYHVRLQRRAGACATARATSTSPT